MDQIPSEGCVRFEVTEKKMATGKEREKRREFGGRKSVREGEIIRGIMRWKLQGEAFNRSASETGSWQSRSTAGRLLGSQQEIEMCVALFETRIIGDGRHQEPDNLRSSILQPWERLPKPSVGRRVYPTPIGIGQVDI